MILKANEKHFKNTSQITLYKITPSDTGLTIYQYLRQKLNISRGLFRKLRKEYRIKVNGGHVDLAKYRLTPDDILELDLNLQENTSITPWPINLDILYQDQNFLAINKPAGMLVHPTGSEKDLSLVNGVLYYFNRLGISTTPRIINRLDRNTSGLVLVAKNRLAHNYITEQLQRNHICREYLAYVEGIIAVDKDVIAAPIGRASGSIIERKIDLLQGKKAVTHFAVQERYQTCSKLLVRLETGRTHQIRVHFQHLGYPLLGDELYQGQMEFIQRQALHSYRLVFSLPDRRQINIIAPLPADLLSLEKQLKIYQI